jgi:NAD(P)-dependent dehydrogenase (short-subunit alcohol dehydrogenase family)
MRVLLTGAFGNVGQSALEELLRQGHQVRCFDLRTKANERAARRYGDRIEVMWGDLRRPEDVARAVEGRDVVVHLAFIIPKLSATGIESEARPDLAYQVNVEGTCNLIEAMKAQPRPPRLVFSSSLHVYGRTQDQPPPRRADDPVCPLEHYSRHKVPSARSPSARIWTRMSSLQKLIAENAESAETFLILLCVLCGLCDKEPRRPAVESRITQRTQRLILQELRVGLLCHELHKFTRMKFRGEFYPPTA